MTTLKPEGNFIDAYYDYRKETVVVWEKVNGKRQTKRYPAPYYFYYDDPNGTHTSIFGDCLARYDAESKSEFEKAKEKKRRTFESDISPLDKILQNLYYGLEAPVLNYSLLDIEVDYDKARGFSSPENPYAPINAITIFNQWENQYYTVAIPPPAWRQSGWVGEEGLKHIDKDLQERSVIILVSSEHELLEVTLDLIAEADVISGWNSENFDLPYLVKRSEMVLGAGKTRAWSFPDANPPYFKDVVGNFGKTEIHCVISGRVHLDYLELFKKFTFGSRESYSLAAISAEEVPHVEKLDYPGSLDGLYVNDFNWFLRYNIRDVEVLEALDIKFRFIALANELAHVNTVVLPKVLGSVHPIDSGIINYCHHVLNLIVHDKQGKSGSGIKGAMVLIPKVGMHEWIGSVDINSLYPSVYRTLNISPEMIIGQFDGYDSAWNAIYNETDEMLILRLDSTYCGEEGKYIELSAKEWRQNLIELKWAVSAYGTVFEQGRGDGFIPQLLANWYAERKRLKKVMGGHIKARTELEKNTGIETEFAGGLDQHPDVLEGRMFARKGKLFTKAELDAILKEQELADFFDRKQNTYKILLNSLYGATINEWCRFFDPRLGASTTSTGRQITKHMIETTAELLTGVRTPVTFREEHHSDGTIEDIYENASPAIIYSDTDSCYFNTFADNEDDAVTIADHIGEELNKSFPGFMERAFLATPHFSGGIQCGRELVGSRAIFQAKKRYVIRVKDLDGDKCDKLKAMGGEAKKSDTPKIIRGFLKEVTMMILKGASYAEIEKYVNDFRVEFRKPENVFKLGIAKSANDLDRYMSEYEQEKKGLLKPRLPGHVRAACNYNHELKKRGIISEQPIMSGSKVRIYYIKSNTDGYTSIAISADATELPKWLTDSYTIDINDMEQRLIDQKLSHLFNAIQWEVPTPQKTLLNDLLEF